MVGFSKRYDLIAVNTVPSRSSRYLQFSAVLEPQRTRA